MMGKSQKVQPAAVHIENDRPRVYFTQAQRVATPTARDIHQGR